MGLKNWFKHLGHSVKGFFTHSIPHTFSHLGHSIKTTIVGIPKHIATAVKSASLTVGQSIRNVLAPTGKAAGQLVSTIGTALLPNVALIGGGIAAAIAGYYILTRRR